MVLTVGNCWIYWSASIAEKLDTSPSTHEEIPAVRFGPLNTSHIQLKRPHRRAASCNLQTKGALQGDRTSSSACNFKAMLQQSTISTAVGFSQASGAQRSQSRCLVEL